MAKSILAVVFSHKTEACEIHKLSTAVLAFNSVSKSHNFDVLRLWRTVMPESINKKIRQEKERKNMLTAGDFKNGVTFEMEGKVYQVIEFQHVKPGKGAAFVRTK
jgi:hypothetical protein